MYRLEKEFRREPEQSYGGAKRNLTREELLHEAQAERLQRKERRRIAQSATTIQGFVRGTLIRQLEKRKLRSEFDDTLKNLGSNLSNEILYTQVGKLLHFYNELHDSSRLTYVCQIFLKDAANIAALCCLKPDAWLYKFQKLLLLHIDHLKKCVIPNANISLSLKFVEVFTSYETYNKMHQKCKISIDKVDTDVSSPQKVMGKIWDYLIKRGYFSTLRLVLNNCVPPSLITSTCPPTSLASSLLDLFSRPFLTENFRKPYFLQFLLQNVFTEDLTPQITCFLLPCLSCQPNAITVDSLLTAIHPDNLGFNFHTTSSLLYAFIYLFSKQAISLTKQQSAEYLRCLQFVLLSVPFWKEKTVDNDTDSEDDEVVMDVDENKLQIHEEIINMVNDIDHVNMIVSLLDSEKLFGQCVTSICCLCHLLLEQNKLAMQNYRLLYTLAFKPVFFRMLWRSIVRAAIPSAFGTFTSLLQIINQGMSFSPSEQETFLPQLIVFCALLNHVLSTLNYLEFYNESDDSSNSVETMPFSLIELASVSATLKDVCMGLIELAYPDKKSSFNRDYVKTMSNAGSKHQVSSVYEIRLWNRLFKVVITLLRHLYSRDCRRRFCPEGTWIAKQFPVFFERAVELYFTNRRGYGYAPFIGLQNLTREQLKKKGPPPSALEARQLAILREFPFAIRFHDRFEIFQSLLVKDKKDNQGEFINFLIDFQIPQIRITVRRNFIYEDAFTTLSFQNEPNIKMRILVQLFNAVGLVEVGVDGGGIFREFLQELLKTCFDPNRGFFKTTHDCLLYPNPNVQKVMPDFARHYFFIGRMLGKAVYENMLADLPLAAFFLAKILSRKTSDVDIHHLDSLDPVMYRNLLYLKTYDGDISELGLDFTVMNSEFGENEVVELKPGGANIPVTENNRITYIHLMADYKLNRQIKVQCQAFKEGLANVIDMEWFYMFDPNELQILISGALTPIDIEDLKAHTTYAGGYSIQHPVIRAFWKIVEGFDERQKRQLLKFVTSCSRAPLLGFKELYPAFCIQNAGREDRLPTASTCMNLLKLPEFDSEEALKVKLSYALDSGAGFELS